MDFLSVGKCESEAIRAEFAHAGKTAGAGGGAIAHADVAMTSEAL
jgi:hypothetical protein